MTKWLAYRLRRVLAQASVREIVQATSFPSHWENP